MKTHITAKTELLATHNWPGAPPHRAYLSNLHAHIFIIEVKAPVKHEDRDIEFHDLHYNLEKVASSLVSYRIDGPPTFGDKSCEQIGSEVLKRMPLVSSVSVSEDGQFSAEVFREDEHQSIGKTGNPEMCVNKHAFIGDGSYCQDCGHLKEADCHLRLDLSLGKRVYIASSGKGDRDLLRSFANKVVEKGYFVFSPCLGFIGYETPEIRPLILKIGLEVLSQWANMLIFFDEGIPSKGSEDEIRMARSKGILVIIAKHDLSLDESGI